MTLAFKLQRWAGRPQPILRLELIRVLFPLTALGFLAGRLRHADELLGETGFHVPDLATDDYRQPLYFPPLSDNLAWGVALLTVAAGLCVAIGYRTRLATLVFASTVAYIALADRLAAFTMTKLTPTLALALFFSPAGARFGVDAWLARRRNPTDRPPEWVRSGALSFLQVLVPVFYCASGVCKARGDWLSEPYVLWTHIHDSYQTGLSFALAQVMPAALWNVLQGLVLTLEVLAPLWLSWRRTRPVAVLLLLGMHAMIGLMFGPVKWFALLMGVLLLGCYLPEPVMEGLTARLAAVP